MITTLVCAVGCKKAEAHKHTWATEWSVGGETHWHACTVEGCTAKKDEGNHEGGTANCTDKKVCTVCDNAYGEVDSSVHKSDEFVYVSNGDGTHTKKYKCCNAVAAEPENCSGEAATVCGEKSVCEVCHAEYGDPLAHDWDTEWTTTETQHWHKCKRTGCEAKKDEADHTVGTAATCTAKAVCATCNAEYGEKDPDNHDLEEHAAKAPTCTEAGWDEYVTCKRTGCTYTTYQAKPALDHDWDTEWTTSETQHWHKCKRTGCNVKTRNPTIPSVLRQPVRQKRFALRVTSSTAKRMPKIIPKRLTDTKRTATARTRKFILVAARQKTLPKIVR